MQLLSAPNAIRVPKIIHSSKIDNQAFLLLEYIESGRATSDFWVNFGQQLAELHKNSNDYFGLDSSNFIGSLPQQNNQKNNWVDFFIEERIQPQIDLAVKHSAIDTSTISKFENLFKKLGHIFPTENPSLIHGDLWSGNYLADSENNPVIFDPSVCYGHREMDLAMSQLFGGFDRLFYTSYNESFPLENDFDDRVEIYQLYYLMVHVNIFGGGYLNSVNNILNRYVR